METSRKRIKQRHDPRPHNESERGQTEAAPSVERMQYEIVLENANEVHPRRSTSAQSGVAGVDFLSSQGPAWSGEFDPLLPAPPIFARYASDADSDMIANLMPEIFGSYGNPLSQDVSPILRNPFSDNAKDHLPENFRKSVHIPVNRGVNGYIKFRLAERGTSRSDSKAQSLVGPSKRGIHETFLQTRHIATSRVCLIPRPPPDFGQGFSKDATEGQLWKFYTIGFCSGRTVLQHTNSWLRDLAPMGAGSELVRCTILALACTYVYEYLPGDKLRQRANEYYERAVLLLDIALSNKEEQAIGKGDAVIGAIALLNMHDVVTYELRRPINEVPRWLEGARLASRLLQASDPSYKYHKSSNIQLDSIRVSNITIIARAAIFALPMIPLDLKHTHEQFAWVLYCNQRETRRIHGASGLSLKLLHMWSQATHLCAKQASATSTLIHHRMTVSILLQRLRSLQQWSEMDVQTLETTEASTETGLESLLASCNLDEEGIVDDPKSMTVLGGQAWVVALKIYLLCRFYRYPRYHQDVLVAMDDLAQCIRRMPTSGDLFTAQIPLLPIFMLGLLSVQDEHRAVASSWFQGVLANATCRSSVNPLWPALKRIWRWLDAVINPSTWEATTNVTDNDAWWERMVEQIVIREGTLCLI